jgi:N-acetylmuramoyl-L-alanine amidase
MRIRGRTFIAAMTACIVVLFCAESHPSAASGEAGRKYSVARERFADLKKSPKKRKYRSYWMDAARAFESVEKKYPASPAAADSCYDRAELYLDLHQFTKLSKDLDESSRLFGRCQSAYPRHARAPEALYHVALIAKGQRQDAAATDAYLKLAETYPDSAWTAKAKARLGIRPLARSGKSGRQRGGEAEIRKRPEPVIAQPTGPREPGTVRNVRYWSGGAYTRIVIDQDRPLKFQAQELKNPDRLVFDIRNARVDDGVNKDPLNVNDGILRQVRTSQYDQDTVRVVLDLASLKSYAAFPLHDPERLVIDVTGDPAGESRGADAVPADPSAVAQRAPEPPVSEPVREPAIAVPPVSPPAPEDPGDSKLSWSSQMNLKVRTIAIDAGHGGHDPGAIGKNGLKEKQVTLDIARRVADLVRERLGVKVIMTRDADVFIPLDERPAVAKTKGADLFVSIHVNATRKRKTRGIETYIQSLRASDRNAMATAALENATSEKTLSQLDSELTRILKDLHSDVKQEESLQLAHAVQASLVSSIRPVQGHVVNLGVKRAFFYVLVNTNMPSILAEVGFISNPEEEKLLKSESYRQKIAEALYEGVKKFVESRNPQTAGI